MKEGEGINQSTYIHNPDTDNNVVIARGKGGWVEVGKGGNRNICNKANNENKVKKK